MTYPKTTAIIGTAGRDKSKPMNLALWLWMVKDAYARVPKGSHVVSGGAAWADHLAVVLFLFGHANHITLHLPAPFVDGQFVDSGFKSAGSTANYYHRLFGDIIGRNTLAQLEQVFRQIDGGHVQITEEAASPGLGGMFARNNKVAKSDILLAYTFGIGDVPADGGTKNTWDKCQGEKTHIQLPVLY